MSWTSASVCRLVTVVLFTGGLATADEGTDYFEKHIRPVLASRCYPCHNAKLSKPMGGFYADSKEGMLKGGASGAPGIVPGKPDEGVVIRAIQYGHKDLRMPPGKPLSPEEVQHFVESV